MENLVELDDYRPHSTGQMACPICKKIWQATFPSICEYLECPQCGKLTVIEELLGIEE